MYDNLINIILHTQNKSSIILGRVWVFSNNLFHSLLSMYPCYSVRLSLVKVCEGGCACTHVPILKTVEARGGRWLGVLPYHTFCPTSLRHGLSLNLTFFVSARLTGQHPSGILLSYSLPHVWSYPLEQNGLAVWYTTEGNGCPSCKRSSTANHSVRRVGAL